MWRIAWAADGFLSFTWLGAWLPLWSIFSPTAIPPIGASGAVAAVMGAYFRLYPRAHVLMVIPPFFLGPFFVVPAVLFLGWWFILQFFNGTLNLMAVDQNLGIAWWAHIGGFVFGAFVCRVAKVRRLSQRVDLEDEDLYR
jgi:membrane associated rhomboid family serine protease